jgi:glycosyltransferase involved in cell wall biosynthesis
MDCTLTQTGRPRRAAMRRRPRVSVILPVYEGERYLGAAIESILAQTFEDFELIVVDDGSTDRSLAIIRSFADRRIRVLENPVNLGLPASLNRALEQCAGTYIARHDADDISEPARLARQVSFLDGAPEVGLVGTWYTEIDAHGRTLVGRQLPCDHLSLRWALQFYSPFVHGSVVFRRTVVETVGPYSEAFPTSQDYEFWLRIASSFRVANLPERLLRLRVHPASLTAKVGSLYAYGHRMRLEEVSKLLDWDRTNSAALEQRFAELGALATGYVPWALEIRDSRKSVEDLHRLLRRFGADTPTDADRARKLERSVHTHAVQAMLVVAMRRLRSDPAESGELVRLARRISGAAFLNPRTWECVMREIWKALRTGLGRVPPGAGREQRMDDAAIG